MMDPIIRDGLKKIEQIVPVAPFEGKNILVTGGAGFIGSWISDVMIDFGCNVTVVDDFSTGRMKNIDHLIDNKKFKLIKSDVCAFNSETEFDFIFHMAAHASPDEYMAHPIDTLLTSAVGTQKIGELARKNNATLLFASTSETYGDAEIIPTPETYWGKVNPIGPRSCYDEGKRFAEALLMAYYKQYNLNVRVPRIFNSYGPRLREDGLYGRALSRFILQAMTNQPITVFGDGKQTRSFCYVTDTVTGLLLLSACPKAQGEVVNVGDSKEMTILELAQMIQKETNCRSNIEFSPLPKDDPKRRRPDTVKLEALVGWKPSMNLDEGLKRTITWFIKKQIN
jgi:UDP-glucuronate decarboxylase